MKMFKYFVMISLALVSLTNAKSYGSSSSSSSSSRSSSSSSSYRPSSSSTSARPSTSSYSAPSRPTVTSPVRTAPRPPVSTYTAPVRPVVTTPLRPTINPVRPSVGYPTTNNTRSSSSMSSNSYSRPGSTMRYSRYSRPITRSPSWYSPSYNYRFGNNRYNSGYHYYPVMCDPYHGVLSSMVMGAIVTNMILDNGRRQPVYSDGVGGAYTTVDGQNVMMAQDENGNWVQLDPTQDNSEYTNQTVVQTQPTVVTSRPVVVRDNRMGFWGWFGIITLVCIVGCIIVIVAKS